MANDFAKFSSQTTRDDSQVSAPQSNVQVSNKNYRVMSLQPNDNAYLHCVSKNIPNFFDCNLKKDYRILIIPGKKYLRDN